jgi:hypothetical protein
VKPLFGMAPVWLALGFSAVVISVVACVVLRRRPSPAARERRRRLAVNAEGRMADATILDFHGDELLYSYTVRGVEYTASQDVTVLRDYLPDAAAIVGPAVVKYHPGNPANSIVVSEEWSGLRGRRTRPAG